MVHSASSRDAGALQAAGADRALWLVRHGESTWNALGPEEHRTFVLLDPSGNLLEFKHYRDPRMMY